MKKMLCCFIAITASLMLGTSALATTTSLESTAANPEWRYFYKTESFSDNELLYIAENYAFPYEFDGSIVYVDGNNIMRGDLKASDIVYTDKNPGTVVWFVAEPEMAFYLKGDESSSKGYILPNKQYAPDSMGREMSSRWGDSLYRYDFATGKSEFVASLPGALYFDPISYNEIIWTRFGHCVGMVDHDDPCLDHDEENYSFYLNLLTGENIPVEEYYQNTENLSRTQESGKTQESGRDRIERIFQGDLYQDAPSKAVPNYTSGIIPYTSSSNNGIYLAVRNNFNLKSGSWYNRIQRDCECHGTNVCERNAQGCTCWHVNADGSLKTQCYGFAHEVFHELFKDYTLGKNVSTRTWTKSSSSGPAVRNYLKNLCAGSHVRFNSSHSVIISAINFDGVVIYEANFSQHPIRDRVSFRQPTFANLASNYSNISVSFTRTHNVSIVNTGNNGHTLCSRTGCDIIEAHTATTVPGYCTKCSAYGSW